MAFQSNFFSSDLNFTPGLMQNTIPTEILGLDLPEKIGCKVYVGNLNKHINHLLLALMCQPFGTLLASKIVFNPKLGQTLGFGYVTFSETSAAELCISTLDAKIHKNALPGHVLIVKKHSQIGGLFTENPNLPQSNKSANLLKQTQTLATQRDPNFLNRIPANVPLQNPRKFLLPGLVSQTITISKDARFTRDHFDNIKNLTSCEIKMGKRDHNFPDCKVYTVSGLPHQLSMAVTMLQKIVEERELSVKKRMIFKLGMMSSVAAAGQSASAIGKGSAGTTAKPTISAFEAINNSRPRNLNRASLTLEARKRQPRAQGGMFGAMRGYLGLNNPSGSRREALKAKLQEQDKLDEDRINITQQIFIPKSVTLPVPKIEKYMTMTDAVIRLKNHSEGSKLVLVSGFPKQVDEAVELLKNFVGTLCDIGFFRFGARIRTNLDGKTGEILAQTTELPPNEGTNALEVFNREIRSKNSSSKNIPETKKKDLRNLTTTELIQRHKMKQLAAKKQQKSDSAESSAGHHRTGGKSASKTTSSETEMVSEEVETPSKTALTRSRSGNSIISIGSNNSSILEISSDEEVPSLPKIPKMEETSNSESMGADRGSEDF